MAQNSWNKCTIKVRPVPQCQQRKRETTCITSCPTSSEVNCKKYTFTADSYWLTYTFYG